MMLVRDEDGAPPSSAEDVAPLVSVVLVVRNGARFLLQAIASVRAQSYRPLELITVVGPSTDGTEALVQAQPDVRYIAQQAPGISAAYNLGIAAARGDIVAFISHDDQWAREKLQRQVGYLRRHPETQYVVGHLRYFLEPGCSLPRGFRSQLLEGEHPARIMETLVVRRSLFATVGLLDPALRLAADVDWFARAQDLGVRGAVLPDLVLHKRVHEANASSEESVNSPELLALLRQSIARRRAAGRSPGDR
jgi:glycosyltransferase involved in cell wall biosynthesis